MHLSEKFSVYYFRLTLQIKNKPFIGSLFGIVVTARKYMLNLILYLLTPLLVGAHRLLREHLKCYPYFGYFCGHKWVKTSSIICYIIIALKTISLAREDLINFDF